MQKADNKYIDITLGSIIKGIIIIALVIGDIWLGVYAYKLRHPEENTNNNSIENNINK